VTYEDGRKGSLKATLALRDARVFDTRAAQAMAAE
jgi:long-chain acyl-CoA synthetase